ncbi:CpaE family protein [Gemmatimonas sp.]|uniref:AAA family ATPase n=1 Tax=Gemmatimonas sp. TaxID=1962908 RepID=UPI0039838BFE
MRRAVIVRDSLGPLTSLVPVFTGAGFGKPIEVESVEALVTTTQDVSADLIVLPLLTSSSAALDEVETLLRDRPSIAAIGTAPTASSDLILAGFRRGLSEFLVVPADSAELAAALARLESRWQRAPKGGHVTAVYSPAGGAGVTTVAVNLAHALALRKPAGRVAVADLVVGLGDVATQLNLAPTYDLGELVRKLDRADHESLQSIVENVADGMDVLAGTSDLELGEEVTADAVQRIMTLMRSTYTYTVMDVEHTVSPRTIAALDGADRIVMVFQVTVAGLRKVKRALALFGQLDFPSEKVVLVANRVGAGDVMSWPDVVKALGRPVDFRLPNAYQVVADAQTRGVPITANAAGPGAQALIEAYHLLAVRLMGQKGFVSGSSEVLPIARAGFGRLLGKLRK